MGIDRFAMRLALIVLAVLIVALGWQSIPLIQAELFGRGAEPRTVTPRGDLASGEQSTIALFETARDSVVFISTAERVVDPWTRTAQDIPRGTGSGFVWDGLGHVVTNHHVVENAAEMTVTLKDRRAFPARLVGSDRGTDIALLEIDAGDLTAARFADSDDLRVGDLVLAIGNPFGLGQTVTSGIVSALGRTGLVRGGYEDFIQTDASINPGNSGGPLINSRGELVGINTAILAPAGSSIGIGFAVPSNIAHRVMEQLAAFGEVRRGRLGISVQSLTPDLARTLGLDRGSGAIITAIEPGSAAEEAGLRRGDVIVAVDGEAVATSAALRAIIGLLDLGEEVQLTVLRGGDRRIIAARVAEAPAD